MRTIPQSLHSILKFSRIFAVFGVFFLLQSAWPSDSEAERKAQADAHNRALALKILHSVPEGQGWVDMGCYRLTLEQFEALYLGAKAGFGTGDFFTTWPDGVVRYSINPAGIADGTIDSLGRTAQGRIQLIQAAMEEWESAAQLSFVEVPFGTDASTNYIEFYDHPSGNFSTSIGMWPFPIKQSIAIVSWDFGVIVHEIGHALGMYHEQSRSDRDDYVQILTQNIVEGKEGNFLKQVTNNVGTAYDFGSIMHYPWWAFQKASNLTTIEPLPAYSQFKSTMGQRNGLSDSDRAGIAAIYGAKPTQSLPGVNPPPGTYEAPLSVSLAVLDPNGPIYGGAYFRYTLDGSDPTEDSTPWSVGQNVILNNSVTFKWRAFHPQRQPSVVGFINYTLTNATPIVDTPTLTPNGGNFFTSQNVSMSTTTPNAQIRYTLNGTTPTASSTLYTNPVPINSNTTVKARAFRTGYTPSGVRTAVFTIEQLQLPTPSINPTPGTYAGSVNIYLSTNAQFDDFRYTLDGSEPNQTNSPIYSGDEITLFSSATVKAKIWRNGFTPSNTASASYTLIGGAPDPTFVPNGGNFNNSVNVTLSVPSKGTATDAQIYYTTTGADPQPYPSQRYTNPFNLGPGTHTVKARSYFNGNNPSAIVTRVFTVYDTSPTLPAPEVKPAFTQATDSVTVTMSTNVEGGQIRYEAGEGLQDEPTLASPLYTGPIVKNRNPSFDPTSYQVKAKVFENGESSVTTQKTYSIYSKIGDVNPPTLNPPGGTYHNPITIQVTSTTTPPNPGIYNNLRFYNTTNGSDPFVPDPPGLGNSSINLSQPALVKSLGWFSFYKESAIVSANYEFKCATPTISLQNKKGINQYDEITVVMETETTGGGTSIRYTLGGAEPTSESTLYSGPFNLGIGTHVLKARAFRNNFQDSEIGTAVFIVDASPESPIILTQPDPVQVDPGQPASFIAEATGVPDPSYQWLFNGVAMAGEVFPDLEIPSAQPGHAGLYAVVVSNAAGSATSEEAALTVNQVDTPTPTETATPTDTLPPTETFTPSETPTGTLPTPTFTETPTETSIETETPTPTDTEPGTPTETPTATPTVPLVAEVVILGASQDNTLLEDAAGAVSNGAGPHFNAGRIGENGGHLLRRGAIAFDVAAQIPSGATITAVTLTLNMSMTSAGDKAVTLHRFLASWGEGDSEAAQGQGADSATGDATWIHRFFDTLLWTNEGGDFSEVSSATTTVGGVGVYHWGSADRMVEDVQSWLDDPSANYGWAVLSDESQPTERSVKQFDSKENAIEGARPALAVAYLPPAPPTPTPTETPTEGEVTATPTPTEGEGEFDDADLNGDGEVNQIDLLIFLQNWKTTLEP